MGFRGERERERTTEMDEKCEWVLWESERERTRQMDEKCEWVLWESERERGQQRWMRSVNGFCGRVREREDNRDG
jgi:hypothetical protein